jgi:hypothetical protein
MAKFKVIENYGYCPLTGICLNPFGIKPLWVQKLAERIRLRILIEQLEEAPF